MAEIIQPLAEQRMIQNVKLLGYRDTPITDEAADHAILSMYRQNVIGLQTIGHALKAYDDPPHDWGTALLGGCSMPLLSPSPARLQNGRT